MLGIWTFGHLISEIANQASTGVDPSDFAHRSGRSHGKECSRRATTSKTSRKNRASRSHSYISQASGQLRTNLRAIQSI